MEPQYYLDSEKHGSSSSTQHIQEYGSLLFLERHAMATFHFIFLATLTRSSDSWSCLPADSLYLLL